MFFGRHKFQHLNKIYKTPHKNGQPSIVVYNTLFPLFPHLTLPSLCWWLRFVLDCSLFDWTVSHLGRAGRSYRRDIQTQIWEPREWVWWLNSSHGAECISQPSPTRSASPKSPWFLFLQPTHHQTPHTPARLFVHFSSLVFSCPLQRWMQRLLITNLDFNCSWRPESEVLCFITFVCTLCISIDLSGHASYIDNVWTFDILRIFFCQPTWCLANAAKYIFLVWNNNK